MTEMPVLQLAAGGCFSRAPAVAARLGIADVMDGTGMSAGDISERTGCDPDVLSRLLQTLALCGVFTRDENGHFSLTEQFAPLRTDHPQSVRNFCILIAETYGDAFGALLDTVRTGDSGFHRVLGTPLYEFLESNPETGQLSDAAMVELARPMAASLAHRYDFSAVRTVIDVGGGDGTMLAGILARHPHLRGVCVDRPSVCARAGATLRASADDRIADRIAFRPADIFDEVPDGGDRYLLKNVLHDWPEDACVRILAAVGRAMRRTSQTGAPRLDQPRLLVVEPLLDQESDAAHALFQTVMCGKGAGAGGFEEQQLRVLLERADFTLLSVEPLAGDHHLFECVPTSDGPR